MTMFRPPLLRATGAALGGARVHLENIKFSHSVFAMPFAIAGALLAARDLDRAAWHPGLRILALILIAVVAARTAAMCANRVFDATLDRRNPRTAGRAIPAGRISSTSVAVLGIVASVGFIAVSFVISPLCGWLSPAVLFVLIGYSFTKRFTELAHIVLGLSLGLAPAGAWLAVQGDFNGTLHTPIVLGLGVLTWVAGFDLIYACQDADHDRNAGLRSIPAKFGIANALRISTVLHVIAVSFFIETGFSAGLGITYYLTVALLAALLAVEHALVRPGHLAHVNAAFFTINGWVSVGFLGGLVADLMVHSPS